MMRLALVFLFVLFSTAASFADQLVINVGTAANDGSGDPVRTAFQKANTNFTDIFANITTVSNSLTGKINAQTGTTYTFLSANAGKLTTFTNASAVAVTLAVFASGTVFHAKNLGVGVVTITPTAATIDFASTLILTKGQSASIFSDGINYQTTLLHPNISSEFTANTTVFLNPKALTTAQTLEIYKSSDSFTAPTNYSQLQISATTFNWKQSGTGNINGVKYQSDGATKIFYEDWTGSFYTSQNAVIGWSPAAPVYLNQDTALKRKSPGIVSASTSTVNDTGQFSSINGLSIGSIFTQTADAALGNTVTETSILSTGSGTKTVAAGALNTIGRTLRVRIKGMISNAAGAPTLTIRFKVATVTVLSGVFTVANATNDSFDFNVEMTTRTTGTSGTFSSNGRFNHNMTTGSVGGVSLVFSGTQTNNLTLSNAIDVTAQWSAANASNSVGSQIATIEILN